jgi:hypothetical protein
MFREKSSNSSSAQLLYTLHNKELPIKTSIFDYMDTFKETGSVLKCTSMGRPTMSTEKVEHVHKAHECSPDKSVCTMAKQL